jgi:5-(carboxyamino)imidazole ribonucleotide synthase
MQFPVPMHVGILGGGQLGRMLALAAYPLGMHVRVFDPAPDACAGEVAELIEAKFTNAEAIVRFADGLDVVTFEWENVPSAAATYLAGRLPFFPPVQALETAQDRLDEKTLFNSVGIETAPYRTVDSPEDLRAAVNAIGLPAVLKTRREGYDGKGQYVLREPHDERPAWEALGSMPGGSAPGSGFILEGFVAFQRELSIVGVRGRRGDVAFYPLVENHHREGILRLTLGPAPSVALEMQREAEAMLLEVMEELEYIGVLCIELFERDGHLLANEIAPRVHNSGHWTQDGAVTSQFENHMRAIANLPLGSTEATGFTAMVNLIGSLPNSEDVLAIEGTHLHLYGKEPRPGRKLGHINVVAQDEPALRERLERVLELVERADAGR